MGLCDSYEEEGPRRSGSLVMHDTEEAIKLFDDPTYIIGNNSKVVFIVRGQGKWLGKNKQNEMTAFWSSPH